MRRKLEIPREKNCCRDVQGGSNRPGRGPGAWRLLVGIAVSLVLAFTFILSRRGPPVAVPPLHPGPSTAALKAPRPRKEDPVGPHSTRGNDSNFGPRLRESTVVDAGSFPIAGTAMQDDALARLREITRTGTGDLADIVRQLKRKWQNRLPLDELLAEVVNKRNPAAFRVILIDGLGAFKRTMSGLERKKFLLALEGISADGADVDEVRIAAAQRYASLYRLLEEEDGEQPPPERVYQAMALLEEGAPLRRQLITSLAVAGDSRVLALAAEALKHPAELDGEALRTLAGAAGIARDESAKESLASALAVAPDARSFATTVCALGEMFDYQVMAAFNEHYRFPEGKLLINHILRKNRAWVEMGLSDADPAVVRASVGAVWKINDAALLERVCQAFYEWDVATRQVVLSDLDSQKDGVAKRLAERLKEPE